jgi:hypothetical protein
VSKTIDETPQNPAAAGAATMTISRRGRYRSAFAAEAGKAHLRRDWCRND